MELTPSFAKIAPHLGNTSPDSFETPPILVEMGQHGPNGARKLAELRQNPAEIHDLAETPSLVEAALFRRARCDTKAVGGPGA